MLFLTTTTAHKTPQFIGIKFAEEQKTSLVEAKNIKSGEIKEGGEVVVDFNGKDEKAKVVVLSGRCTLSLLWVSFYTLLKVSSSGWGLMQASDILYVEFLCIFLSPAF